MPYTIVERHQGVTTISLNRPSHHNAFDEQMLTELLEALQEAARDPACSAVVLGAVGGVFCAGVDFEPAAPGGVLAVDGVFVRRTASELFNVLVEYEKPIVGRVQGPALGFGSVLVLMCDVVVMAREAVLGDNHVALGLVAGDGGAALWPLVVGVARAKELLLTSRLVSASEALAWGIASEVVSADALAGRAAEVALALAALPAYAARATKLAVNRHVRKAAADLLDVGMEWLLMSARPGRHQSAAQWVESALPEVALGKPS